MHLPIFLRLLGVKVIADGELFSDSLDNLHANRLLSNLLGTYEHKVLGLYNLFKVSTQFHAQTLERIGLPKNRILLIPMSVNINAIPKFAITDIPEHTFGYFGALEHWQGPDLLLNSFKLLLQSMPNAKLYIIGEGSMKKKLEHMIASVQLADNIIMVGGLPRQAIWEEYFRRFRILVIPRPKLNNSTDALPSIKLIEALAAGKVVIATDIPAMREVPADSIFLVPPGDSESLAKAMHSLSNDQSELQRYSSAALNASHHYDIRSNFKQLISALENL
jgi:glycosyltransferase involved in cell wall biosynthesis